MSFERQIWLIAYDIREPRRLRRVHKFVSRNAFALQYSLFAADLDARGVAAIISGLEARARTGVDDVRLYALPKRVRGAWQGPLPNTGDVDIFGSPAATLARRLRDGPLDEN